MEYNLLNINDVASAIAYIETSDNVARKNEAFDDYRVFSGGQYKLLQEKLRIEFPESFADMRPVEYNFCKKIVNKRAKIYKDGVQRTFLVNDEKDEAHQEVMDTVYKDLKADKIFHKANQFYELNSYTHLQVFPLEDFTLSARALPAFLVDVIPDIFGQPQVYILSHYLQNGTMKATSDSLTGQEKIYTLWNKTNHVVISQTIDRETGKKFYQYKSINGNPENKNPLEGFLPFITVKQDTDGFFYPMRNAIANQSFVLCLMLSDVASIARTQGFGQATLIAHENVMPESVKVGIKSLIKIPIPQGETGTPRFEYVNSNAPISEQMQMVSDMISLMLSTNDLKAGDISGKISATDPTSGIAKLIESAELTDAISESYTIFNDAEQNLHTLVMAWLRKLKSSGMLPEKYNGFKDENNSLIVHYNELKPIQGEEETLNLIERKQDLGLILPWEKHKILNPTMTEGEAKQREEEIKQGKDEAMIEQQDKIKNEMMPKKEMPMVEDTEEMPEEEDTEEAE